MTIFRKIKISFWQDQYILKLSPSEKYFYLYLLTNSQTKQCGIYEIPIEIMKLETGLEEKEIYKHIEKLQKDGKIKFNKENSEIMILNWAKHNFSKSIKVIKCAEDEMKNVKTKLFIKQYNTICKEYGYSMDTLSQEEREKDKEKDPKREQENPDDGESDFHNFNSNDKHINKTKNSKPKIQKNNPVKTCARECFEEQGPNCRLKSNTKGLEEKCIICLAEREKWKKEIVGEIK